MTVQLQKIIRDLWIYRLRTGLSIFAICVGLVFFGAIATARDVLKESYEQSFVQSNPAQIMMKLSPFESNLLRRVDLLEDVVASDGHFIASDTRLGVGLNEWIPLELHAAEDYGMHRLHRIFAESGTVGYAPPRDTIWLDRSILQRNSLSQGDWVIVQDANGEQHPLQISGFVNDVIAFPSHLSDQAVAFVSFDTLQDMKMAMYVRAGQPAFNTLYLRFSVSTNDVISIRELVSQVEKQIQSTGYEVFSTDYLTDDPPLEAQTDVLDTLLVYSTALTFVVTGVLIGNFVSAIVGRQINEIGIMKSLGAVPSQIIILFFVMMIIMGLIAFTLAFPLTDIIAKALSQFLVNMIDIDAVEVTVPLDVRLFQFFAAILLPLIAALIPVLQGARITIKETLRSDGNVSSRFMKGLAFLPRLLFPMILFQMAVRNIFLKPGRFMLTTTSLILPGALFISSFGIETALLNLDTRLANSTFNYDIEFTFDGDQPIPQIQRIAERQAGVLYVEAWRQGNIHRVYGTGNEVPLLPPPTNGGERPPRPPQNGNQPPPRNEGERPPRPPQNGNQPPLQNAGESASLLPQDGDESVAPIPQDGDESPPQRPQNGNQPLPPSGNPVRSISGDILLRGIPINSQIIQFTPNELTQGDWLKDDNDILLTYDAYEALSLHVDRSRQFVVEGVTGEEQVWDVAGVSGKLLLAEGFVDINRFERFIPHESSSIRLAIVTVSKDVNEIKQILEMLRTTYNDEGITVNSSASIYELVQRRTERLGIVTQTLITLSIIVGVVSVIGLISTISINTRERTKSIGILRSLGGDYRHLGGMVLVETLTIVFMSYVLGFGFSYVIGHGISNILGNQMYSLDPTYHLQWFGVVVWFVVMVLVGIIATLGPALYAINITISDTLRYEG